MTPSTKSAWRNKWTEKVSCTLFFHTSRIEARVPCKKKETINSNFHTKKVFPEAIRFYQTIRPRTGAGGSKIHHENASLHKSVRTEEFLQENSPESIVASFLLIRPCTQWLFSFFTSKNEPTWEHFASRLTLKSAVYQCLAGIPENDSKTVFKIWLF